MKPGRRNNGPGRWVPQYEQGDALLILVVALLQALVALAARLVRGALQLLLRALQLPLGRVQLASTYTETMPMCA